MVVARLAQRRALAARDATHASCWGGWQRGARPLRGARRLRSRGPRQWSRSAPGRWWRNRQRRWWGGGRRARGREQAVHRAPGALHRGAAAAGGGGALRGGRGTGRGITKRGWLRWLARARRGGRGAARARHTTRVPAQEGGEAGGRGGRAAVAGRRKKKASATPTFSAWQPPLLRGRRGCRGSVAVRHRALGRRQKFFEPIRLRRIRYGICPGAFSLSRTATRSRRTVGENATGQRSALLRAPWLL